MSRVMIDFTTFFTKKSIERLSFATRRDVNYLHEMIFLASYLHDSTFLEKDFKLKNGVVTVLLDRCCWEFFSRIHRISDNLPGCKSRLKISGVQECKWSKKPTNKMIEIRDIFIGERQYLDTDTSHLVINTSCKNLRIDLFGKNSYFDIQLEDQEDPR